MDIDEKIRKLENEIEEKKLELKKLKEERKREIAVGKIIDKIEELIDKVCKQHRIENLEDVCDDEDEFNSLICNVANVIYDGGDMSAISELFEEKIEELKEKISNLEDYVSFLARLEEVVMEKIEVIRGNE